MLVECRPRRHNGRWICTRSEAAGGPCEQGPTSDGACACQAPPCSPVRTLHARRGLIARWVVIATLVVLAGVIGVEGYAFLMPGPLTSAHAAIGECHACHTKAAHGPLGLLAQVFLPAAGKDDSAKCLACHVVKQDAFKPHTIPPRRLAALTKRAMGRAAAGRAAASASLRTTLFPADPSLSHMMPCATCHIEHRGAHATLTAVPDANCQSCHVTRFASFAAGHPEFDHYPYHRRTRIVFDHATHFRRHFPKSDATEGMSGRSPTTCSDCHELGAGGRVMLVRSFDQVCGACHLEQIRGLDRAVGPRGVSFISVPGLDLRTLRERNIPIGNWPALSDANVTPFMKLLLVCDPVAREALQATANLDLMDLRSATDAQLAAVGRLAWAIKELIQQLSTGGQTTLRERLVDATGGPAAAARLARLMGSIPRDVMLGIQRDWLPNLPAELAAHWAGKAVPTPAPSSPSAAQKGAAAPDWDNRQEGSGGAAAEKIDILGAAAAQGDSLLDHETPAVPAEAPAAEAKKPAAVDEEAYARLGGWYRQDFQLLFHPTGHADPFLKAWIDYAGGLTGGAAGSFARPVFDMLAARDAPGQCAKCHSVERAAGGRLSMMWHAKSAHDDAGGFTKFRHAPHLQIAPDKGCATCHQLDTTARYLESFTQFDPFHFASDFKPMAKVTCVGCHTSASAGDNCLLCHNYHVTPFDTPMLRTKISDADRPPVNDARIARQNGSGQIDVGTDSHLAPQ